MQTDHVFHYVHDIKNNRAMPSCSCNWEGTLRDIVSWIGLRRELMDEWEDHCNEVLATLTQRDQDA